MWCIHGCAAAGVSKFFSGPLALTVWAPERRAAADRCALDGRAAARAVIARLAVGNEAAGVCAALRDRAAQGGAHGAAQVVELGLVELARRPPWREPRLPEDLVGEQVADARQGLLVEQPRLDRRAAATDAR